MSKDNVKNINETEFRKVVRHLIEESIQELGDPMDQKLNQHDHVNTSEHPNELAGSPEEPIEEKGDLKESVEVEDAGDATEVKMNSMDKADGSKSEAVVSVEASSSKHSGEATEGMAKSKEETKSGMNDSENENGGDDKGTEASEVKMNSMDKEVDEGTKTYVEAGKEDSTGQKDAKWSEDAKNEKKDEPIADAIQLPEGFGKTPISSKELMKFINESAEKIEKLL